MSEVLIEGKRILRGKVQISGAKNAVLPEMAACLLTSHKVVLTNVPKINEIDKMKSVLEAYGVKVMWEKSLNRLELHADKPVSSLPTHNVGGLCRSSFLVLGPLLARLGQANVYLPGGCNIEEGGRKVDYHIQALKDMGATWVNEGSDGDNYVSMVAEEGFNTGGKVTLKNRSVGATENAVMAACLVEGTTIIRRAAVEPEIHDLAKMLSKMGAEIWIEKDVEITEEMMMEHGEEVQVRLPTEMKWNVITVRGRKSLSGVTHSVMPDRIEFGTYAIAAAMTNGQLFLKVAEDQHEAMLKSIRGPLEAAGVKIDEKSCGIEISLKNGKIYPVDIETAPYPGFPTDLLPQWVAFMTQAQPRRGKGFAIIKDNIYSARFKCVEGLRKMKAEIDEITASEYRVHATGQRTGLVGTRLRAPEKDLRGAASLVLAALSAKGNTAIKQFEEVSRGYEGMVEKLNKCGGKLELLPDVRPGHYGGQ